MFKDKNKKKRYWLYVLKLEQGKYYVGVTSQTPEIRMQQHKNSFAGARWTSKFQPIKIFDKKDLGIISYKDAEKNENVVVRKYINKYGINNVRGGDISYTSKLIIVRHTIYDVDYLKAHWLEFCAGLIIIILSCYLLVVSTS